MNTAQRILVTGASGYIGGRLIPRLLEAGHSVRCLVRDPSRLQGREWRDRVEVVVGDIMLPDSLSNATREMDVAYYLVHSMSGGANFQERDKSAARNFSSAAKQSGVKRIIYLGGLGDPDTELSEHLRSRQETGEALRDSGIPVTEFRAAVIVGSGSLSFEIIRYLTERLPVMVCPRWLKSRVQPIAIRNILDYLVACLQVPESAGRVVEIGGRDVLTYGDMIRGYANVRGLRRWLLPVPVLTPRLSSYWIHMVTPVPAKIVSPLVEGLRNDVVVRDETAASLFPDIRPIGYEESVRLAVDKLERGAVDTSWADALSSSLGDTAPVVLASREGMIIEQRTQFVKTTPSKVFKVFTSLGGQRGWLCYDWSWRLRGAVDRLLGGVGMRRGRRDPVHVRVGDALDFWRVEAVEPDHLLRLRAEMKVPGRAWLQFEVEADNESGSRLTQTAFFASRGLAGFLYWYALYPIHSLIFRGLIREIARFSEKAGD